MRNAPELDVVVVYDSGNEALALEETSRRKGRLKRRAKTGGFLVVSPPEGTSAQEFAASLKGARGVHKAEPDALVRALLVPNDPYYSSQWGMQKIGMPSAWDETLGSSAVKIAVVDTGVDLNHSDLVGRIDTANDWDFVNNDATADDDQGHGTHCAGIAAASTNNGLYVSGVAPLCTILPVKVLSSSGYGTNSSVADGIRWAANQGADVISLSLGGDYSSVIDDAVQYAAGLDCVIIAASGNDSSYGVSYPARLTNVIAVGSTTSYDTRSSFSNYGPEIDLCAPGTDILSTTFDGGVGTKSGTSMATPHVAGVAALVRSLNPTWDRTQVEQQLTSTAADLGQSGRDIYFGAGRVQAAAAVGGVAPPPPVTGDDNIPGVPAASSPISGSVNSTDDRFDVYRIALTAGQTISLSLSASGGDTDLFLWDSDALSIGDDPVGVSNGTTYPETISYTAPVPGDYYVAAYAFSGACSYTLTYSKSGGVADDDIPGVVAPASPIESTINAVSDTDDVYRLSLTAGQVLSVSLSGSPGTDFDAYLYPPGSTSVWTSEFVASAIEISYPDSFVYTVPSTGVYYLDACAYSGSGAYTMAYSVASALPPDSDDDVPGISIGASPRTGTLSEADDVVDVYSCFLSEGKQVTFDFSGTVGTDFDVYLFAPGTASIYEASPIAYSISSSYPEGLAYSVPSGGAGTYYVAVYAYSGIGSYALDYSIDAAVYDDNIPGVLAPASPVSGYLSYDTDTDDVYRIAVEGGDTIIATLDGSPGTDFDLYLFPPGSNDVWTDPFVDGSAQGSYPELISYTVPSGLGGTYYLDVYAYDGSGSYSLSYSITHDEGGYAPVSIEGVDRYETAVVASQHTFVAGSVDTVVVASGANWPDALGGGALAGAVGGPVLLVRPDSLPWVVSEEFDRLGAQHVIILGGYSAISGAVENAISALPGVTTERIGGSDRYATAGLIAQRAVSELGSSYDGKVLLSTGTNYPDALAASPLAAGNGWPIVLTKPTELPYVSLNTLIDIEATDVVVIGGVGAVSNDVKQTAEATVGSAGTRLSGTDRFATAAAIATYGVNSGLSWNGMALATGRKFPDALAAGSSQGRRGSVILLSESDSLPAATYAAIASHSGEISEVWFLGGSASISNYVRDQVRDILQ